MSKINIRDFYNENEDGAPDIVGVSTFSSTAYFVPTKGTTAQRPSDHVEVGSLRFNTDTSNLEFYRGDTLGWSQFELIDPDLGGGTGSNTGVGVRGLLGGYNVNGNVIEFLTVSTLGNTQDFGDLTNKRNATGQNVCNRSRMIWGGGYDATGWVNTIDFITVASLGNAVDFGDTTQKRMQLCAVNNNTRGIFFSVWDPSGSGPSHKGHIDYITIATAGNSADFGELSVNRPEAAGFSSPTRGICAGGYPAADGTTMSNVIDYITIATTGNASDFGDLTQARQAVSGASSQTRGVVAAGAVYASTSYTFNINTIDYVTIASTGNAADFGDLSAGATGKSVGNCSNQIRGVFGGGKSSTPTYINTVEFINIAATGNAFDFGDLTRTPAYGSVMCDSHGGLS